ncbi:MAG TPA: hypothetical protein VGC79_10025 [Polyangiaceae bacterium]
MNYGWKQDATNFLASLAVLCAVAIETSQFALDLAFLFSRDLVTTRQLRRDGVTRALHGYEASLGIGD